MIRINEIRAPIDSELKEFEKRFKASLKSRIPLLNLVTNYLIRHKGKQMRPMFVFLTAKMLGEIGPPSFTAASLIELLHTASLVHDDVVDESYERRGFFSIKALWKSKVAVLLGDYLLARGLLLAVNEKEYDLLQIVSDAVKDMSEGELYQIQKSRKLDLSMDEYFDIVRMKTATLIAACTACGARSVGSDAPTVEKFREFGHSVGMAFQIKDDLLDYMNNGNIGKPSGNDLKEKKLTLPLIYALEHCTDGEKKKIIRIIRKHNHNSQKISDVTDFVKQYGGLDFAGGKMIEFRDRALAFLDQYPGNPARESLRKLVEYTVSRKR